MSLSKPTPGPLSSETPLALPKNENAVDLSVTHILLSRCNKYVPLATIPRISQGYVDGCYLTYAHYLLALLLRP